jgi:hypothetical protein
VPFSMRWWASAPRRDTDLDMGVPGPGGLVVMENGQVGEGEVDDVRVRTLGEMNGKGPNLR